MMEPLRIWGRGKWKLLRTMRGHCRIADKGPWGRQPYEQDPLGSSRELEDTRKEPGLLFLSGNVSPWGFYNCSKKGFGETLENVHPSKPSPSGPGEKVKET